MIPELAKLRHNIDRMTATAAIYDDVLKSEFSTESEANVARLKLKYARSDILRVAAENRKLLQSFEAKEKP